MRINNFNDLLHTLKLLRETKLQHILCCLFIIPVFTLTNDYAFAYKDTTLLKLFLIYKRINMNKNILKEVGFTFEDIMKPSHLNTGF